MKHKSRSVYFVFISIAVVLFLASCSESVNWTQFRGAESNLVASSGDLPETWGIDTNVAWTYKINGNGWSSPVVWGDKVIILSTFPEKVKEQPKMPEGPPEGGRPDSIKNPPQNGPHGSNVRRTDSVQGPPNRQNRPEVIDTSYKEEIYRWEITCVDLKTGKKLWKNTAFRGAPRTGKNPMNTYASETPVTDGKRIYAYFGMVGLFCYDMDGKLIWRKDLGAYQTQMGWGTGSSPILFEDKLYVQVDNEVKSFVIALDTASGEEKWKVERDEKTNYSTPIIWKNKVRTELVVGGKTTRSYDPKTGSLLWELKLGGEVSIPSAVADEEHLYIGNEGRKIKGDMFSIKAGAQGDISLKEGEVKNKYIEWTLQEPGLDKTSPLLYNGLIYIISGRGGEVTCINALDGKVVYKQKIDGVGAVWASPWAYNDKIFFYDEKGRTHVFKAGEQFEELHVNKLDDKFWASVAFASDAIILRGVDKLFCLKNMKK